MPAGTPVGINLAFVHLDNLMYGSIASEFDPERWSDTATATRMDRYMLHFGGGSRACMSRYISLYELYTMVPELFKRFAVELVDNNRSWTRHNSWFNKQFGILV